MAAKKRGKRIAEKEEDEKRITRKKQAGTRRSKAAQTEESSTEDNPTLIDYATRAKNKLLRLSKSQRVSDKLLAFNILVFVPLFSLALTHLWIQPASIYELGSLIILLICFVVSLLVGAFVYGTVLEVATALTKEKTGPLRVGLIILLLALPVAAAGLFLNVLVLTEIALAIIAFQIAVVLSGIFIDFPAVKIQDTEVEPEKSWKVIGRVASVVSILDFIGFVVIVVLGNS
jgi:multisubunit Na+/H+ antiporter MnhF subunit